MIISLPLKMALLIRVEITEREIPGEDSVFVTYSPELPGLLVTAHDLGAMFDLLPDAIEKMLDIMGQKVTVIPAMHPEPRNGFRYFVAIPEKLDVGTPNA